MWGNRISCVSGTIIRGAKEMRISPGSIAELEGGGYIRIHLCVTSGNGERVDAKAELVKVCAGRPAQGGRAWTGSKILSQLGSLSVEP